MKNNTNDSSKRTAGQVAKILRLYGIGRMPQNQGDGRLFSIIGTDIKTRYAVKKAGFILERSSEGEKTLYFRTH